VVQVQYDPSRYRQAIEIVNKEEPLRSLLAIKNQSSPMFYEIALVNEQNVAPAREYIIRVKHAEALLRAEFDIEMTYSLKQENYINVEKNHNRIIDDNIILRGLSMAKKKVKDRKAKSQVEYAREQLKNIVIAHPAAAPAPAAAAHSGGLSDLLGLGSLGILGGPSAAAASAASNDSPIGKSAHPRSSALHQPTSIHT
jgi:hypothetical protein